MVIKRKFLFFVVLIFNGVLLLMCLMFKYVHKGNMYQPFKNNSPVRYHRDLTQRVLQDLTTRNLKSNPNWYTTNQLINRTSNCTTYFDTFPAFALQSKFVEEEEKKMLRQFPKAFAHMVHTDISILEVFLSIYFRPDNFHCVHVDAKAAKDIRYSAHTVLLRKNKNGFNSHCTQK